MRINYESELMKLGRGFLFTDKEDIEIIEALDRRGHIKEYRIFSKDGIEVCEAINDSALGYSFYQFVENERRHKKLKGKIL